MSKQHYSYRFIWWDKETPAKNGKRFAIVHLMVGYNQMTLADFNGMARELRKEFPFMKDSDIRCGCVTKSHFCERHTVVAWSGMLDVKGNYANWTEGDRNRMSYWVSF